MLTHMKAARYHPSTGAVSIDHVPIPYIGKDEILVKMASASLCHSDLMLLDDSLPGDGKPIILGHEGCGYVAALGARVQGFQVGDAIGFLYTKGCCSECPGCMVHNLNFERGTAVIQGFGADGFFAEYAAIDGRNAIVLPANMDPKTSAPFFCAGITAFHAVDNCELHPGDWLAVVGCGGLGQLAVQCAKAMGCQVVGLDVNDEVLANAKSCGADVVISTRTDPQYAEHVRSASGGGAHAAAVFSGVQAAYDTASQILQIQGVLMVIGLTSGPLQFNCSDLMKKLFRIKSESTGPPQKMGRAIEFVSKHDIRPPLSFFTLDQFHDMVEVMKSSKVKNRMAVLF